MNVQSLLRYFDQFEPASLFLPALLLLFVGHKLIQGEPACRARVNQIAGLFFLVMLVGQGYFLWPVSGDILTEIILKSLLFAGVVLGCGWIVGPAIAKLYNHTLGRLYGALRRFVPDFLASCFRFVSSPVRFFLDRGKRKRDAIEEERLRREGDIWARERAIAQKRRDDARAACEFLFSQHAPEIENRFTRPMLDDFIRRYMGDGRPPDEVEERAEQLRGIIRKHLEKADPPPKQTSLAELAQWYLEQKEQIDQVALDKDDKQLLLSQLEERYMRLQEKYFRSVQP